MTSFVRTTVAEGILEGETCCTKNGKQYHRYLGIPYAKPPTGELRFQNPIPSEEWSGRKCVTVEGNCAPQIDELSNQYIGDEDCLYLNIAAPAVPEDSPGLLPVFVYIHGGGFASGSGSFKTCGPEYIVEKDCLFVSFNYRLNVLGFLCLETDYCPGNVGLQDQHLALKWIKNNISSFGGDPENVTLIGISAGAASIESHVISPKTPSNLFNKVILHSGTMANFWSTDRNYLDLAHRLARKFDKETKDPRELFEFLKNTPAKDLVSVAAKLLTANDVKTYGSYGCFKPVIWSGNEFLNKLPTDVLKSGDFLKVPTVAGFCSEEFLLMENLFNNLDEYKERRYEDLIPVQINVNRQQFMDKFRSIYGLIDKDSRTGHKSGDFITDLTFLSGIFSSVDHKLNHGVPLYFYRFSYDGNMNYSKKLRGITSNGTCHADDQTYIGTNCDVTEDMADANDVSVRKKIIHMWTDFAKYGNPTPRLGEEISIRWLPMKRDEFVYMDISTDLVLNRGLDEYMNQRRELWMDLYKHYE